ncbi:MAG: hypothetical protein ACK4ZW_08345 [Blastomonas sp.]
MAYDETPEIECPDCNGHGERNTATPSQRARYLHHDDVSPDDCTEPCPDCGGRGWRPMTEEEAADAAADAFSDMCESEPPVTMAERQAMAWREKKGVW